MAYNPIIADILLDRLAAGEPLMQLCKDVGTTRTEIFRWREDNPEFKARYAQARIDGFEALAEDCLNIADDNGKDMRFTERGKSMDADYVQRSRIRIDTRLKLLACWDPSRYGQKQTVDATVRSASVITTLPADVSDQEAARIYQAIMKDN